MAEQTTTLAGAETMLPEQSKCDGGAENDGGERRWLIRNRWWRDGRRWSSGDNGGVLN
ncbi:hypothetical protein Sjap_017712 [Stephania japonica]|uniref:Uncharacterized protein n=1 Tax=Stephania japonica TaxID=461633 RepID=A0AAP0I6N1_9MAGN